MFKKDDTELKTKKTNSEKLYNLYGTYSHSITTIKNGIESNKIENSSAIIRRLDDVLRHLGRSYYTDKSQEIEEKINKITKIKNEILKKQNFSKSELKSLAKEIYDTCQIGRNFSNSGCKFLDKILNDIYRILSPKCTNSSFIFSIFGINRDEREFNNTIEQREANQYVEKKFLKHLSR